MIYSYFHTEEPNNLEIGCLRRSMECIVNVPCDQDTQAYIEQKEILRIRNTSFLRKLSFPDNMSYLLCIVWRLGIFRKPPASFRGRKLTWNIGIENIAFFEASNNISQIVYYMFITYLLEFLAHFQELYFQIAHQYLVVLLRVVYQVQVGVRTAGV